MDFLELANSRYATKKYEPTYKISDEKIERLMQILRMSPSSINSQPWNFIFVGDKKLKDELAEVSFHNTQKIKDCSYLVVFNVYDDLEAFDKQVYANLPEGAIGFYEGMKATKSEAELRCWMSEQVYIALGWFLSACAAEGLDSTPMEGIQKEVYTRKLGLKEYHTLLAVAVGKHAADDANHPSITPKKRLGKDRIIKII